jgi:hypothetical protein
MLNPLVEPPPLAAAFRRALAQDGETAFALGQIQAGIERDRNSRTKAPAEIPAASAK